MSDTLTNALAQSAHSQSVLAGIQNPAVLNPLAGMGSAISAVSGMQGLADSDARQALGEAYQKAVDPATGRFDPLRFNQLAAADPRTARAVKSGVESSQTLQGQQLEQNTATQSLINGAVTAALASDDGNLKQSVLEQAQRLRAAGIPGDRIDGALLHLSSDPAQLRQQLETLRVQSLPPQQRQDWIYGTRPQVSTGGATVFPTVPAAGRGDAPIVLQTLTPEQRNATVDLKDPRKTLPDGSPNPEYGKPKTFTRQEQLEMNGFTVLPDGRVIPPAGGGTGGGSGGPSGLGDGRYSNVPPALRGNNPPPSQNPPTPNAPAAPGTIQFGNPDQPQAVPAPPGSSAPAGPYTGGGIGTVLAPAAPGPRSDVPQPNANVAAIMQGMQNARVNPLGGSAMTAGPGAPTAPTVAATPEPGWGTAPGTYSAAPTAPTARPAATQPAPPAQRSPFDRPPMGLSSTEEEQLKAAGPSFNAEINAGTNAQTQQALLGNMLVDTKQFLPGPWAETWKNIRARLAPAFNVNDAALAGAENFDKAAAQLANAQGAGSDSRMSVNIAANPHGGMSAPGVDLAIRQLQGNADYIQARAKLAQQWPNADYNGFVASARQLDPRVFQYERMTGSQRDDYLNAMDKKDAAAFISAHNWAEQKGLIPQRPRG